MSVLNEIRIPDRPESGTLCAGADVGGTTVKLALADDSGAVRALEPIPTRGADPARTLDAVAERLSREAGSLPISRCGAGFPGIVRDEAAIVGSPNMPQWTGIDVAAELRGRLGAPVRVGNDANVAALAESRMGGARAVDHLLFLTLGTGVGTGIVAGGRILSGHGGFAGEGGHVTVRPDGLPCGCGRKGCLEAHFSELGLVESARRAGRPVGSAKELFDLAKAGDAGALELLDEGLDCLAVGISDLCAVLDPEEVVLGGGIAKAGPFLLERLAPHLERRVRYPGYVLPRVRLSALGSDAGVLGALELGLR